MGDRVLIQVVKGNKFSPVAYGHDCGYRTPEILARLKARMVGREGDLAYTAARLMQEMTDYDEGNLSFGLWNAEAVLEKGDSHGDAGIVLIDVSGAEMTFTTFGGYLETRYGSDLSKYNAEDEA